MVEGSLRAADGHGEHLAGDREVEHEAEDRPDRRAQAAQEEHVAPADVVLELEAARVDPLNHAQDGPHRPGGQATEELAVVPAADIDPEDSDQREGCEQRQDARHAGEVDDLRLTGRGVFVVVGHVGEGPLLILDRSLRLQAVALDALLVCGTRRVLARVDEAQQVRGAGHDQLEADPLANAREDLHRARGEIVTAMHQRGDLRRVFGGPVAGAVEGER